MKENQNEIIEENENKIINEEENKSDDNIKIYIFKFIFSNSESKFFKIIN